MHDDDRDQVADFEDLDALEPADEEVAGPHGDGLVGPGRNLAAEEAFVQGTAAGGSERMLAFYDRLRGRVVGALERRGGRLGRGAADALMVVPDVFMLLVRLALDPQVPRATRGLIGGALAYFLVPFDLLPEALVGGVGFLDDLVLATAVLTQALGPELEPQARRYWSGRQELRQVLRDVIGAAQSLLGENLLARLERLLARRGVALPAAERRPPGKERRQLLAERGNGERAFDGFEGDPGSDLA
jgi:uncharacterized membrane protein YkvA (DUF1232 family)